MATEHMGGAHCADFLGFFLGGIRYYRSNATVPARAVIRIGFSFPARPRRRIENPIGRGSTFWTLTDISECRPTAADTLIETGDVDSENGYGVRPGVGGGVNGFISPFRFRAIGGIFYRLPSPGGWAPKCFPTLGGVIFCRRGVRQPNLWNPDGCPRGPTYVRAGT